MTGRALPTQQNSKRLTEILENYPVSQPHFWLLEIWPRLPEPIQTILQQMNPVIANVKMGGNELAAAGISLDFNAQKVFYTLFFDEAELENRPSWFIRYIVVHELAHLANGDSLHSFLFGDANRKRYVNYDPDDHKLFNEQMADLRVYQWGFDDEIRQLMSYENDSVDLHHRKFVYQLVASMREQLADWEITL